MIVDQDKGGGFLFRGLLFTQSNNVGVVSKCPHIIGKPRIVLVDGAGKITDGVGAFAMEKKCRICGMMKSLESFPMDKRIKPDGRVGACRECLNAQNKENQRRWRTLNRESHREYCRKLYSRNRERELKKGQEYRDKHREQLKAYQASWYVANRNRLAEKARTNYQENIEKRLERQNAYYMSHKEEAFSASALRRARKKTSQVERVSRDIVYERDRGRCHICGRKVAVHGWHMDHLVPLARGGEHSYKNVAVACPRCNLQRNAYGPAQLRLLG